MRIIIHCDLDCFYCQVEHVRLGIPDSQPLAVLQWSGLVAVNYAARACGVSRFDKMDDARRKCPHLRFVHVATYAEGESEAKYHERPDKKTHKVSLDVYRRASQRIFKIFNTFVKSVEKASVDEAYMDITDIVERQLSQYRDAKWDGAGVVLGTEETSVVSSEDLPFYVAAMFSQEIRKKIFDELGYTCSIGIAENKTLAKLCSAMNKPNKQTVLLPSHVLDFMKELPLDKIRFLGGKLGHQVTEEMNVKTAGELWKYSLHELQVKFGGETGKWLFDICRGKCLQPVTERMASKSMLAAKALYPPLKTRDEVIKWLQILSTELLSRLMDDFEENNRWPKTLTFQYKCVNDDSAKSKSGTFPRRTKAFDVDTIAGAVSSLFKEVEKSVLPCSRLSIGCNALEKETSKGQATIDSFFKPVQKQKRDDDFKTPHPQKKTARTSYREQDMFDDNVKDAWLPELSPVENMRPHDTPLIDCDTPGDVKFVNQKVVSIPDTPTVDQGLITCERCGHFLFKDDPRTIQEHADWHFAQDLAK